MIKNVFFVNYLALVILILTCRTAYAEDQGIAAKADTATTWEQLQHTSLEKLNSALTQTPGTAERAWLELAIISKRSSTQTQELVKQLLSFRQTYPDHPANALFPDDATLTTLLNTPPPSHIALLLPLHGPLGAQGKMIRDGFLSAYYQSLADKTQQQTLVFYDTSHYKNMYTLYKQALRDGATLVIGPLAKDNVQQLLRQNNFPTPVLVLNYTDAPSPNNVYQYGLSPIDEAQQVADKAYQSGATQAILIAPSDAWGERSARSLITQWRAAGGTIRDAYYFKKNANFSQDIAKLMHIDPTADRTRMRENNNKNTLAAQRRQDFDVIFLLAGPSDARIIVPLLKYYYAENIPVYATSVVDSSTARHDPDLNGIHFLEIPRVLKNTPSSTKLDDVQYDRFYAVGLDAYLLSQEWLRLSQLPRFPLYANTGALSLAPANQIYRRLPWTQIHAGPT